MEFLQHLLILEEELQQEVVLHFLELYEILWTILFEEIETRNIVASYYVLLQLTYASLENR